MMITATDFFCGAGGSSTGLVAAGFEVRHAANHWQLAINTHATNHPRTEHSIDDIQQVHPSRYPHTDVAWFSPECTNHSLAKGRRRKNIAQCDLWGEHGVDPAEERSRATMREVVEFSAYHLYKVVFVENVVDIRYWAHFEAWWKAMLDLGYQGKIIYLNARFFNVPQSRDRFYAVFWRKGMNAPDLEFRPVAFCPKCDQPINAVQSWKRQAWGRYGKNGQYVYRCPKCAGEVFPAHKPARDVIDWSLDCPAVGSRERPLAKHTLERIRAGLQKFAGASFLTSQHDGRLPLRALGEPLPTVTTMQNEHQLVIPPFVSRNLGWDSQLPNHLASEPIPTVTTFNNQLQLVVPPFTVSLNHTTDRLRSVDTPLDTVMTQTAPYLTVPPLVMTMYNNASYDRVTEPLRTITGAPHHALVIPDEVVDACGFRMLQPCELKLAMSFPDTYTILGSKADQTRQVGNAVCCNVAQWLGERVMAALVN